MTALDDQRTTPTAAMPRRISTAGSFALAISNVGPTISIGVGLGVLATVVGPQAPITFIIASLPMIGIAISYAYLNRVEPNCGTAYVWLRTSFSPWAGYLTGWIALSSAVIFLSYGGPLAGKITLALANSLGASGADPLSNSQSTAVGILWVGLVTFLAVRGTDLAVRAQLVLATMEILIIAGIGSLALITGDAAPVQASWFDPTQLPSVKVLASGLILAVYVFWGWDSAFSVNEETKTPRQASKAGFITLGVVLAMFVFSAMAFQRALTTDELVKQGALGLPYLGQKLAGDGGELIATMALLMSAVAILQAVVIASARVTLAMGRDQTLGRSWAKIHPRFGTPARATLYLSSIAVVLSILGATLGPLQTVIGGVVTATGILISLTYGLAGLASAWRFRSWLRTSPLHGILAVVLPTISAAALFSLGGYLFWQQARSTDHFEFDATNGWFLDTLPGGVLLLGVLMALWTRYVRKAPYFTDPRATLSSELVAPGSTPSGDDRG